MTSGIVRSILTDEVLARFELGTEEATGLPNDCYTSAEWLEAENKRLFARTWMLAGFCHDIPGKGDACPVEVAGMPLVILRDNNNEVRVLHNVCRHRGAIVVPERCTGQRILSCPYHAWAYGLDGTLRTRPHFFGGDRHDTDPGENAPGLVPVRHAVWHDLIFVNISGDAVPFEEHWATFARCTPDYHFTALVYAKTLEFDVKGNWKLIYENFYDAYHVPTVHPNMNEMVPMRERDGSVAEGPWIHNTSVIRNPQEGRGIGMPFYPGLDEIGQKTEWYFVLFPAMAVQLWPDQLAIFQLNAVEPGRTLGYVHLYFIGEAATEPQYERNRQDVYDMWENLNVEDFGIVENMQRARSSPAFDGGALSPYWDPATCHFAKLMAQHMMA